MCDDESFEWKIIEIFFLFNGKKDHKKYHTCAVHVKAKRMENSRCDTDVKNLRSRAIWR